MLPETKTPPKFETENTQEATNYRNWFIPFAQDDITLREGLASLKKLGAPEEDIPFIIRLIENPEGLGIFPGSVNLHQHDCIHLVLGRGLLPKDEAFTIGFTMGSTKHMTTWDEKAFSWICNHCYPDIYRFTQEDSEVFRDAVRLGSISRCKRLDQVEFVLMMDKTLKQIRKEIGLEAELINAYFSVEKNRYPRAKESQRLIITGH